MLIISKKTPTTARRCATKAEAVAVVSALIEGSISFYCEPEPDDMYLVKVNYEAGYLLDRIFHALEAPTALEQSLAQAQRAFNQNPTPALSTSIKRLVAAVKREWKKAL